MWGGVRGAGRGPPAPFVPNLPDFPLRDKIGLIFCWRVQEVDPLAELQHPANLHLLSCSNLVQHSTPVFGTTHPPRRIALLTHRRCVTADVRQDNTVTGII